MYYVGNVSSLFSAIKFMINNDILGQGDASWLKSLFYLESLRWLHICIIYVMHKPRICANLQPRPCDRK